VEVLDGAQQPPQPAGIVVHTDCADPWKGHRAGVTLTDPDADVAAPTLFVAQPEAVTAVALLLAQREPDLATPTRAALGRPRLGVGGKRTAEVDRGLLEHLRGNLVPPCEAGHLPGDRAV
jgi:hypothetical protein